MKPTMKPFNAGGVFSHKIHTEHDREPKSGIMKGFFLERFTRSRSKVAAADEPPQNLKAPTKASDNQPLKRDTLADRMKIYMHIRKLYDEYKKAGNDIQKLTYLFKLLLNISRLEQLEINISSYKDITLIKRKILQLSNNTDDNFVSNGLTSDNKQLYLKKELARVNRETSFKLNMDDVEIVNELLDRILVNILDLAYRTPKELYSYSYRYPSSAPVHRYPNHVNISLGQRTICSPYTLLFRTVNIFLIFNVL